MHKVTLARNEISPLLDRLIQQLEAEGRLTQRAHFRRIQRRIEVAHNDWDLKSPIIDLSVGSIDSRYVTFHGLFCILHFTKLKHCFEYF